MLTNENYEVSAGAARAIGITLIDSDGLELTAANGTALDGTQTFVTRVWPGGSRPVSCTPDTAWIDPTLGTVRVDLTAAQTAALTPGRYQLLTRMADGSADPVDVYGCTLEVLAAPGTDPAPRTYCDYSWLLRFGRGWLRQVETDDDQAGFAQQLGQARSWLEDLGHARYRTGTIALVVNGNLAGPRIVGGRNVWLQQQFDADTLMLTDQLRECVAKKALAYICEGMISADVAKNQYAGLARMYHSQSDRIAVSSVLELDTDGDGFADIRIDMSCTVPMYG